MVDIHLILKEEDFDSYGVLSGLLLSHFTGSLGTSSILSASYPIRMISVIILHWWRLLGSFLFSLATCKQTGQVRLVFLGLTFTRCPLFPCSLHCNCLTNSAHPWSKILWSILTFVWPFDLDQQYPLVENFDIFFIFKFSTYTIA